MPSPARQRHLSPTNLGLPPQGQPFDPKHLYLRSHILSPLLLAILRAIIALYGFTTIIVGYSWLSKNYAANNLQDIAIPAYTLILGDWFILKSFSFFTFITFYSLTFYFAISAFHGFVFVLSSRRAVAVGGKGSAGTTYLHDSFPRFLQAAHTLWQTSIITYPFLVSIVYWCTMYGGSWSDVPAFTHWINISVHGLNSLWAIVELTTSAVPPPPFTTHLLIISAFLGAYLGLAYLSRVTADFWVYEWMNPVHGWVGIVGHVVGYGAGMIGIYGLVWSIVWGRERVFVKHEKNEGVVEYVGSENASEIDFENAMLQDKTKKISVVVRELGV